MGLSNKQRAFVTEYVRDFNATRAAKDAGYSPRSAYSIGNENLKKPEVAAAIQEEIETRQMARDEVLLRLADQARGDMGDFMDINSMSFSLNLEKAKELGLTKLIKKLKQKTVTTIRNDQEEETNTIEIELYDAHAALVDIGKHLKIFSETIDVELKAPELVEVLRRVYGG